VSRPSAPPPPEHAARLVEARERRDRARDELAAADADVLREIRAAVNAGGSIRMTAELGGVSASTVQKAIRGAE